jgi:hypothetical protein
MRILTLREDTDDFVMRQRIGHSGGHVPIAAMVRPADGTGGFGGQSVR